MEAYDAKSALDELKEDAALPHPVRLRDMILRTPLDAGDAIVPQLGSVQFRRLGDSNECSKSAAFRRQWHGTTSP